MRMAVISVCIGYKKEFLLIKLFFDEAKEKTQNPFACELKGD